MAILFVGVFLSHALPYFELLGVTPFLFMCALFMDYFGAKKILPLFLVPTLFLDLFHLPSMIDLSKSMVAAFNYPWLNGGEFVAIALLTKYFVDIILLFSIHKAFHKVGIYSHFQF